MNTLTGKIDAMFPTETPEQFARRLGVKQSDLVPLGKLPEKNCPKCHGTGAIPKGLFSKRFKPCDCTYAKAGIAAI